MNNSALRCAVFGANGYIGTHLSLYLKTNGHQVFNYDLQSTSTLDNYSQIDICCKDSLNNLPKDFDKIFFFSGISGTHESFEKAEIYLRTNELGLINILEFIKNNSPSTHFIYPSTRLVYKGSEKPLIENSEKEAKTIYAVNKLSAENILNAFSLYFNLTYTIFRICVPYGNIHLNHYSFGTIGFFLKQIGSEGHINLYGDGHHRRTFTHIYDLCKQIVTSSLNKASFNETFNIDGEDFSLFEIAQKIANHFHGKVIFSEWNKRDLLIESGSTVFDSHKIRTIYTFPLKYRFTEWLKTYSK